MSSYYIGMDLGGTYCRVMSSEGICGSNSRILKKRIISKSTVEEEIYENLFKLVDNVIEKQLSDKLIGIGISLAAPFERGSGVITKWPNRPIWNGFPILQAFRKKYSVPIIIEDDANSAALGEHIIGCAKGYADFLYITIGTGVGCGIIINNKLLNSRNGQTGNIGHMRVVDSPNVLCRCGSVGCLQAIASGPAIVSSFKKNLSSKDKHIETVDMYQIKQLADKGNRNAINCLVEAGKFIGETIGNLALFLDISLVVLGGGMVNNGAIFINAIKDSCERSIQQKKKIEIKISTLGDYNGLIGAVANIENHCRIYKGDE